MCWLSRWAVEWDVKARAERDMQQMADQRKVLVAGEDGGAGGGGGWQNTGGGDRGMQSR